MANNKLRNCSECGRIFVDMGLGVCKDCYDKQQDQMQAISSYVRDNPRSTIREICEALDVKERLVMRMIREGRFVTEGITIEYECERCGASITQGRFCEKCSADLTRQMEETQRKLVPQKSASPKEAHKKGAGMYSRDIGQKLQ